MKQMTAIAAALLVAGLMAPSNVAAQDHNPQEVTYFTFSGPVEMPNVTLPAGTYTFRMADIPGRSVIQVMRKDDNKMLGQFFFVPVRRAQATGDPIIMFKETAADATPAVQSWYYPARTTGRAFVYPKDQAQKIAARTHSKVYASDNSGASIGAIDETGNVTPLSAEAQPLEPASSSSDTQVGQVVAETRTTDAVSDTRVAPSRVPAGETPVGTSGRSKQVASNELPHTSSPLALSGLVGLFSLLGGLGVRAARQ